MHTFKRRCNIAKRERFTRLREARLFIPLASLPVVTHELSLAFCARNIIIVRRVGQGIE
jgi:hypothetical protein